MNDVQPDELSDNLIESNHVENCVSVFPQTIKLINSNEIMKRRKIKAVLRFHKPNKTKEPEHFCHHLLMLYFPWRKENELGGLDQLYSTKVREATICNVVENNRVMFEPNADAVDIALQVFNENPNRHMYSYDVMNDQENDDLMEERNNEGDDEWHEQL